jgi:hypothetical protein
LGLLTDCEPPLSIYRIQWLDMRKCIPIDEKEAILHAQFKRLLAAIKEDDPDFRPRAISHESFQMARMFLHFPAFHR